MVVVVLGACIIKGEKERYLNYQLFSFKLKAQPEVIYLIFLYM